jgi:glycosyltransferase involved in cell wall biosynthesis
MKIAVQSADLDASRIDGTRVYLWQLLRRFGSLALDDEFILYHRKQFNAQLTPPDFSNYHIRTIPQEWFWTQTKLLFSLRKDNPDVLWMPVQSIPVFRSKKIRTVVTIHDLAFRYFPESFPMKDRIKLNILASLAIKNADALIAVSEHTKKDILYFYPDIDPRKITVVHHGYDGEMFKKNESEKSDLLDSLGIERKKYILYVGALQPRKNLTQLIRAFEILKKHPRFSEIKLVFSGERAWLWHDIERAVKKSAYTNDIILPGKLPFASIVSLYKNAGVFAYPSFYEGFGLPILEGFASGIPVVCANNSSLPEVGGDAVLYFDTKSDEDLTEKLIIALEDVEIRKQCILRGRERLKEFSWEKCAQETLSVLRG